MGEGFEPLDYWCIEVWVDLTVEMDSSTSSVVVLCKRICSEVSEATLFFIVEEMARWDVDVLDARWVWERHRFVWLQLGSTCERLLLSNCRYHVIINYNRFVIAVVING